MTFEPWDYPTTSGWTGTGVDLVGYKVHAVDGDIGKVDEASNEVGSSYLIVDTGPWIFGQKVLLPAGLVERIDTDEEKIYVAATKDQIKNAPEYHPNLVTDATYRSDYGSYYSDVQSGRYDSNDRG